MDPRRAYTLTLLCILSLVSLNCKAAYGDSTVVFLDSPTRQYLRQPSTQTGSLSPTEIGATASVLLGFSPPSTLTAASSSKLNEVLKPNPFDRPRAMLMLEVTGAEDSQLIDDLKKSPFSNALRIKVEGDERVDIQLPDENEVSLVSLNGESSDPECSEKELSDFASWLGGSYTEDASGPLNGELILPMADGAFLRLHMSERADREFATSLVTLVNNIRRAKEIHQVFAESERSPAELITGRFDGIKALQDRYGKEGIAQSGLEVFVNSISKAFDSLQAAYQGKIVGVIAKSGRAGPELENMFHVTVASRPSARWLEETKASPNSTEIAEVLFVRTTLAWITGIILLIATILGILFLLNMPLTRDTLLYSNVKLD
ncbi:hypothetical protein Sango_0614100 [Sesamum angolense]|uniref:DUF7794 domain-containing protein n=1 Tax=Sesamum angolense TaxID=2727404 RepID=A0AAE1X6I3_9LAMI|nr:hypothetical protein Sango_0614100 [Sesamum angolense]